MSLIDKLLCIITLQTFYKKIVRASPEPTSQQSQQQQQHRTSSPETTPSSAHPSGASGIESENNKNDNSDGEDEDDDEENGRGVENRLYIKELLITHPIWKDGNYWEQTLWQCAIEQVRAMKLSEDLCSSDSRLSTSTSSAQSKVRLCVTFFYFRFLSSPVKFIFY